MLPVVRHNGTPSTSHRPTNRLDGWFERVFEDLDRLGGPAAWAGNGMPLSIWEDEDHYFMEAEIPGTAREDVELTVHNGVLAIRVERKPAEGRSYLYNTRAFGRSERYVKLPEAADPSSVEASLTDGLLKLTFKKKTEAKPRRIEIQPNNG